MGDVYEAQHRFMNMPSASAAIKFLNGAATSDDQSWRRFTREAAALHHLRSDHIVRLLDFGRSDSGQPYLIMELMNGETLESILETRGKLEVPHAVQIGRQVCAGLGVSHRAAIVHRDLKPSNLMIARGPQASDRQGARVVLIDFGLATHSEAAPCEASLTRSHAFLGTPLYMAPEQIRSARDVDARVDIYSLGVILYQILSGRRPFSGATLPDLVADVMRGCPTPLSELCPGMPDELAQLIEKCLHRDPDQRFASAEQLSEALARFDLARPADLDRLVDETREQRAIDLEVAETVVPHREPRAARRDRAAPSSRRTERVDEPAGTPPVPQQVADTPPPRTTEKPARKRLAQLAGALAASLAVATLLWTRANDSAAPDDATHPSQASGELAADGSGRSAQALRNPESDPKTSSLPKPSFEAAGLGEQQDDVERPGAAASGSPVVEVDVDLASGEAGLRSSAPALTSAAASAPPAASASAGGRTIRAAVASKADRQAPPRTLAKPPSTVSDQEREPWQDNPYATP